MFGHNDNTNNNAFLVNEPKSDGTLGHPDAVAADLASDLAAISPTGTPTGPGSQRTISPAVSGTTPLPPVQATPAPAPSAGPAPPAVPSDQPAAVADDDDLLALKQQALQQLTPLVSHLEQTPEEKFRTTMMMIQAADNKALLSEAYEAALSITDEKVRAQALLDVVNEINYFTQKDQASAA